MKRTGLELKQFFVEITTTVAAFLVRLSRESERSAVILGVARVDRALERALKALLNAPTGASDSLFDQDRPLATFSAKIVTAHRLGLIDDDTESVLQALRKIRNGFAHSIEDESLSLGSHGDRLRHIVSVMGGTHMWQQFAGNFMDDIPSNDLRNFAKVLAVLIAGLESTAWANERVTPEMNTAFLFQMDSAGS